MALGPRSPVVELNAVAQQQLREPVPGAHQIQPQRFPRAHEITQRFLLRARHADLVKLSREQQPGDVLSVARVGLHAVPTSAWDLRRCRDHALDPTLRELARRAIPGRARLISDAHGSRQTGAEPGRRQRVALHRERLQLARVGVQHRRDDLRRVHVQTDEGSSLRHGWFVLFGCGPPRGWSRAA